MTFSLNSQIFSRLFHDVVKDTGDFIFYELMVHGLTDDFVGYLRSTPYEGGVFERIIGGF
jgi:hypothetical protein